MMPQHHSLELLRGAGIIGANTPHSQMMVACPYHQEKTPSLSISLEKGIFHCFGCGEKGTIAKLFKDKTSLDPYQFLGLNPIESVSFSGVYTRKPPVPLFARVPEEVTDSFIDLNNKAVAYIKSRGISMRVLTSLGARYAPIGTRYIYDPHPTEAKTQYLGDRLMIPLYFNHKLVNYEGRDVSGQQTKCVYLKNHSSDFLFRYDDLCKDKPLFVFEGVMDAILLLDSNLEALQNVTCLFGAGIAPYQLTLLKEFKHLVVVPDNDPAGDKLVERITSAHDGVTVERVPSTYKDLGQWVKNTPIADVLLKERWLSAYHKNACPTDLNTPIGTKRLGLEHLCY